MSQELPVELADKAKIADFQTLSKAEQRVAIAEDVIKALRIGKMIASKGGYFIVQGTRISNNVNEMLQDGSCEVCAVGALFASEIMKTNEIVAYGTQVKSRLVKYFTRDQIQLIEAAFEEDYTYCSNKTSVEESIKASNFCRNKLKYYNTRDSMIVIMKNIIENKGTFIP